MTLCSNCFQMLLPALDGRRLLYFYDYPTAQTKGPYSICEECFVIFQGRLKDASAGRDDILADGAHRISLSIDRPQPYSRAEMASFEDRLAAFDKLLCQRMEVLNEVDSQALLIKRKLQKNPLRRPLPPRTEESPPCTPPQETSQSSKGNSEASSDSPCNPPPCLDWQDTCLG